MGVPIKLSRDTAKTGLDRLWHLTGCTESSLVYLMERLSY